MDVVCGWRFIVEWLLGAMSMVLPEYVHLWMATQGQRDQRYSEFSELTVQPYVIWALA